MKATLEFEWPDDKEELRYAVHGVDAIGGLRDIDEMLRRHFKHGGTSHEEMLQRVQQSLWKTLALCGEE